MSTIDLAPTMQVPGYALRRQVGGDATGVWFEAVQENLGRLVTVKVLQPDLEGSGTARRAFVGEMNRLAPIEHGNLLCVLDARRDERLALVVEACGNRTVADELDEQARLGEAAALARGRDVARALAYLTRMQLGCLRVAPAMIHVFGEARCRLMTLGNVIPFHALAGPLIRSLGSSLAPEQREGHVSTRTPSYHVAALLVEMLTGRPAGAETMRAIAATGRVDGSPHRALSDLVRACAQPDPGLRPAPGTVAEALDRLLLQPAAPLPRAVRRRA